MDNIIESLIDKNLEFEYQNGIFIKNRTQINYGNQQIYNDSSSRIITATKKAIFRKIDFITLINNLAELRQNLAIEQKHGQILSDEDSLMIENFMNKRYYNSDLLEEIINEPIEYNLELKNESLYTPISHEGRYAAAKNLIKRIKHEFGEIPEKKIFRFEGTEYYFKPSVSKREKQEIKVEIEDYYEPYQRLRYTENFIPKLFILQKINGNRRKISNLSGDFLLDDNCMGLYRYARNSMDMHNIINLQCAVYSEYYPLSQVDIEIMNEYYLRAVDDMNYIPYLHWYMCLRTPFIRGGGTLPEWICGALLRYHNIDFTGFKDFSNKNIEPWAHAITSGIERFSEIYQDIIIVSNLDDDFKFEIRDQISLVDNIPIPDPQPNDLLVDDIERSIIEYDNFLLKRKYELELIMQERARIKQEKINDELNYDFFRIKKLNTKKIKSIINGIKGTSNSIAQILISYDGEPYNLYNEEEIPIEYYFTENEDQFWLIEDSKLKIEYDDEEEYDNDKYKEFYTNNYQDRNGRYIGYDPLIEYDDDYDKIDDIEEKLEFFIANLTKLILYYIIQEPDNLEKLFLLFRNYVIAILKVREERTFYMLDVDTKSEEYKECQEDINDCIEKINKILYQ